MVCRPWNRQLLVTSAAAACGETWLQFFPTIFHQLSSKAKIFLYLNSSQKFPKILFLRRKRFSFVNFEIKSALKCKCSENIVNSFFSKLQISWLKKNIKLVQMDINGEEAVPMLLTWMFRPISVMVIFNFCNWSWNHKPNHIIPLEKSYALYLTIINR